MNSAGMQYFLSLYVQVTRDACYISSKKFVNDIHHSLYLCIPVHVVLTSHHSSKKYTPDVLLLESAPWRSHTTWWRVLVVV